MLKTKEEVKSCQVEVHTRTWAAFSSINSQEDLAGVKQPLKGGGKNTHKAAQDGVRATSLLGSVAAESPGKQGGQVGGWSL